MAKPVEILDRDPEWHRLNQAADSAGPELCFVLGRRRAGKSYLLARFAAGRAGVYYQATRKTEREQLASLTRVLGERFDDAALRQVSFEQWEQVFAYLVDKAAGKSLVVVLDEFPYLADAAPALTSILQAEWDQRLAGSRIKLILSGSHISAMRKLSAADQPLHGRRTLQLEFLPFDYLDAALFTPDYAARDRLRLYGILGGLPGQLALVNPQLPLAQNAARLLLDPTARLYDEAVHMLDAFLGDAAVHYSIVEAIALGETRWSKISNRVGRTSSSLLNPLNSLLEMGLVRQEAPITAYPNPPRNRLRYVLADPYLVFWHRFIGGIRARGLAGLREPEELWAELVRPQLDRYMGAVFEDACRRFLARARHPRIPFRPVQVGSWWTDDGQREVDVVALGPNGETLLGEAKWGAASRADLALLMRRGEVVVQQLRGVRSVRYALFSGMSAPARAGTEDDGALRFTLADLYAE